MLCPCCQTSLLTRTTDGIEIEECPSCQGIWCDTERLRRIKDESDPDLHWMDFELWRHPERFHVADRLIDCPKCELPLIAIDYDDTEVEVDFCTRCRGVWLDANELSKIVDSLSAELLSKDVSDYLHASLEEARELVGGPESFLSEWRDLRTVLRMLQYRILGENPRLGRLLADIQASSPF